MKALSGVGLALLMVAACSSGDAQGDRYETTTSSPIQAGQADPGHPAVGLVWFQGGGFCTGTLVTPQVVLTAGHCVQDPIDGFYTGVGTATTDLGSPAAGLVKHDVDAMANHPSYSANGGCPNATFDIGLIHLSAPLAGVTPIPIATGAAPTPQTTCDAIGYGTHTANGKDTYQAKRSGTEIVQSVAATSIEVKVGTGLADHGDSGGPLVCNGEIAGATSCHTDGDWPQHQREHYARVDAAAAWIEQQIAAWASGAGDAGAGDAGKDAASDGGGAACAHATCAAGTKLEAACDPCAASICASDPYCCQTTWDSQCVGEVGSICNATCN